MSSIRPKCHPTANKGSLPPFPELQHHGGIYDSEIDVNGPDPTLVPISNAALQSVEAVIDTHCSNLVFSNGGRADFAAVRKWI